MLKKYCLVPWRQTPEGLEPDLPEGLGFLLLAEPRGNEDEYALFLVSWPEKIPMPPEIELAPGYLVDLLKSAEVYPPALAMAREKRFGDQDGSRAEFIENLTDTLRAYLDAQRDSPFFLAKVVRSQGVGYKNTGCYYWIVGYRPDRVGYEVNWISRDFFIYQDAVTDFDLDVSWLAKRFSDPANTGVIRDPWKEPGIQ